jgi:predicted Zn-dependent protease
MSTHPDPGNRVQKTLERIAAAPAPFTNAKIERDAFLRRLDGMVFGDDPRNGYFQQAAFIHPTLKFRFDFPQGWRMQNSAEQVVGASAQGDAQIALTLAGNLAPTAGLQRFSQQQGVQMGQVSSNAINGNAAAVAQFVAQNQDGSQLAGYVAYIQQDNITYQLLAITPRQQVQAYDAAFRTTIGSFQRVTDPRLLNVKPQRLRLVQIRSAMTLSQFNQQNPSVIPMAQLALINGVEQSATIPAGTLVKRVVPE